MVEGAVGVPDDQCRRLLGEHYHPLEPPLGEPILLDDWRKTNKLIAYAKNANIDRTGKWLQGKVLG